MKQVDQILRFVIDATPIRGQLISLDASWRESIRHIDASEYARDRLGEALAAVALLASTLKMDGKITLQIRGQGAIHLLVAQASSERTIRGLVRQNSRVRDESAAMAEVFGAEQIVVTIESGKGQRHQGIVPLIGHSIAEALEAYFEQSEQLPTRLWLATSETSAAGLLLQKLPGESLDEDAWERTTFKAATITSDELLNLPAEEILYRLFHEESLRVFDPDPIRFSCSCSRQRTVAMLRSLGPQEARGIIREQGSVEVNCEFCNAEYRFDAVDVEQLFHPDADGGSQTVH